ncbi:MAG: hypothetical protein PVG07_04455 [Acidobacteriota bacterium]|jgi:hypothetical protein
MKKTSLTVLALFTVAVLFALPAQAEDAQTVPAPAVDAQVRQVDTVPAGPGSCDEALVPVPVLEVGSAWDCPFGAPFCSEHDDCDDYCGDPRFGYCEWNGCCSCLG